jgi:protein-S-isoprenylcysteine O-methyltransferase Ste14
MLKERIYPYLLVAVQFGCLIFLLKTGPVIASGYAGMFVEALGVFLGVLAIYQMGIGNFNVTPRPKENGQLVTHGIYRIIRHPMYSSQLIALLPLLLEKPDWYRISAYLLLLIALLLKIRFEEEHLKIQYAGYGDYIKKSKRLVPFIY